MSKQFVVRPFDTKRAHKPMFRKNALEAADRILGYAAEWEVYTDGPVNPKDPIFVPRPEARQELKATMRDVAVGGMIRMQGRKRTGKLTPVYAIHCVETLRHAAPLPAEATGAGSAWEPIIIEVWDFVTATKWKRGQPHFAGAYACRANRRDASLWSMHCYWPKTKAIDFGVDTLALGDEIAHAVEARFPYPEIIVVWRQPLHYTHGHYQAGHNIEGRRPACA